ncbi:MAG: SDR family oxidoreductase [Tunicatimonas sp.]|uniref:SDR family oxidoreductase n=1 Tax=Tunicatimonas sp. TaxID=1940096 RepID=UPI003C72C678
MNSKIALVTGANRGIGREVCSQLAKAGHQVILTSRDEEKGKKVVEELKSDLISYHPLDVTDDDSVAQLQSYIETNYGRLDILVNNAGINYDTWQNAEQADLQSVQKTLNTNLLGPWRVSQAFIPLMRKNGYGRIVNVSSGAGALNGMGGGTPAYSVSKASLNVLTIKLAADLQNTGILVNSVGPGWVRTDMGGKEAPRDVTEGAEGVVWAATLPDDGPTGGFFRDGKLIEW